MKPNPHFSPPATRDEAHARLDSFLPHAGKYSSRRNHVVVGHENVSQLSPATRTRLLLETEICKAARARFSPSTVEKFEQEVWWRLYWKGWLEMRPSIWERYRVELADLEWSDRAKAVAAGESGCDIMDYFAKELVATGYMHNHARMWWAAYWVHVEKLPWQLGADFFLQHLHDGDAASNTLSWRWVAGLHTKGKNYLVRRSNVEKFVAEEILSANRGGIERLENTSTIDADFIDHPAPQSIELTEPDLGGKRIGIWVHDEDLLLETSPFSSTKPVAVQGFADRGIWERENYSEAKQSFLETALGDGVERAGDHFSIASGISEVGVLSEGLASWAVENELEAVVAMQPFVGTLFDETESIRAALAEKNIELILVRRPHDVEAMNKATAGFFGFWKKTNPLRKTGN